LPVSAATTSTNPILTSMQSIDQGSIPAAAIRLEVRSVDQLLNPEASPFLGPRLDPAAGERILNMARSSPKATRFMVELTVPAADLGREDEVRKALDVLAREAMEDAEKELREIFRNGRVSLFVGFLAVAALLGITELLLLAGGDSATVRAITESIIIVYWVILWRPAELLLYEHFPARRRRKAARALVRADVHLVSADGSGRMVQSGETKEKTH
jgi:hypothetical protein